MPRRALIVNARSSERSRPRGAAAVEGAAAAGNRYPAIEDYAVIGDTRSAALIARDGTIEWLCLPIFHSPSIFAALLDRDRGGRWSLRPTEPFESERRYEPGTNVLATTFRTGRGTVRVEDAFSLGLPAETGRLVPEHELIRIVTGVEGEVEIETVFAPRPNYGRDAPRLADRGALGLRLDAGSQAITLLSEVDVNICSDGLSARGATIVAAGERRALSLVSDRSAPAVHPRVGDAHRRLEAARRWWAGWANRTQYDGAYRDAVVRSALTLKLMVFSPSGAIIAAPTTSLPERIGGTANWDYRYCWLRDAAFTIRALYDVGHEAEAASFLAWLLHATRVTLPRLQIMYDVYGEARLPEVELPLAGYAGSAPVRIGNAAAPQPQLDVYGEVIDAAVRFVKRGGALDASQRRMIARLGEAVCRLWEEPDHGIWELRGPTRHYTHSKMLAWVALDRLLELAELAQCDIDRDRIATERARVETAVETRGFNRRLGSYVATFDGETVDAGVLSAFLHGYGDWASPRVAGTVARIDDVLGRGPLVYRFAGPDGPTEATFGATAFWMVECLARLRRVDEARGRFELLLRYANDVGLFAEEIAEDGRALGNFPQGLTHIALINAALALEEQA